ncbi:opacity family porin [Neisseria gonorrhoeae]|uniref:opacity family porin n=1 Tax=Neisseria gonorrhoeae TaxID=485 RepID=UPI000F711BEB|nr:opacity family porin [Neisseria gonorrhoeae]WLF27325.1 opacity family porin [Neisseria gonorrhoeae]BBH57922.1 outer membrane preprotein PIIc [Neisseria gonorrhoeae]BBH62477.1 outer membrane preprotein PIIc [Neisseria gonorrhoeae]
MELICIRPTKNFSSLLFSSLLFSSAAQAASEGNGRGPYVQADLAYAAERITHDYPKPTGTGKNKISTVSDYFRNIRTHSIHPRVSVGYDFGGWRIAADYARYRKWNNNKYSVNIKELEKKNNKTSGGDQLNIKHQKTEHQENGTFHAVSSLGLSTIYDFDTGSRFKPYIGMRVAYGHVRHGIDSTKKTKNTLTAYHGVGRGSTYYDNVDPEKNQKNTYRQNRSSRRLGFGAMAGVGIDVAPGLTLDAGYRYHYWGRLENTRFKTHEASLGMRYRF